MKTSSANSFFKGAERALIPLEVSECMFSFVFRYLCKTWYVAYDQSCEMLKYKIKDINHLAMTLFFR